MLWERGKHSQSHMLFAFEIDEWRFYPRQESEQITPIKTNELEKLLLLGQLYDWLDFKEMLVELHLEKEMIKKIMNRFVPMSIPQAKQWQEQQQWPENTFAAIYETLVPP